MYQTNDAPASSRIRENQRRSRTRRAELLASLQRRVHEYERQGVTATLEMQRAARKVAHDNFRLHSLLALHGVSREEVDAFLRLEEGTAGVREAHLPFSSADPCGRNESESNSLLPGSTPSGESDSALQNHHAGTMRHHVDTGHLGTTSLPVSEVAEAYVVGLQCPGGSDDIIFTCPDPTPSASEDAPPGPRNESRAAIPGLEISCQTAATIIVEMRGDGDEDLVRDSLGCNGRQHCTIKNTTVLQVIDQSWG